ncbi:Diadenosine hexaphosphate hydrolase [Nocardioides dokdonensis FR1436]|uniref:Diadenosine hexaphosphate hydrolase n=1 Tax=Nocardioides dokdonensis FR1436 TaxID=1300347 RepID=A0A1A9GL09_9ACTN|nr:NUDIX hydrolase [Nocardioides dokdonensis]ANH38135.1 Diadenosine hexaphosphate hydrolase [Nocardioides dokdonensis FR1436]
MAAAPSLTRDVHAAGAVVFRPGREVLLVHRERYDDWSFPKGKVDPGEHPVATAVREVEEETGLRVSLGRPLPSHRYPNARAMKTVHYWTGRVVGADDVSGFEPNAEISDVRWVPVDEAAALLSYERDQALLQTARASRRRTQALVVQRHSRACARSEWTDDDRLRPLERPGLLQAEALGPLLAAYDVRRLVTSPATRCRETLAPYAATAGVDLEPLEELTEEAATGRGGPAAVAAAVTGLVDDLHAGRRGIVLCTHRPVLPMVFEALGVDDPGLAPGEMVVVHLRRGRVLATEQHLPH